MKHALKRFIKYASVGFSTFLFDLFLLFIFIDILAWNYVVATAVAFLIAVSVNYCVSRRYVFRGTLRDVHSGYAVFILIALIGLGVVTGGMMVLVGILGWHYAISRILIAGIVGMWNYLMNLYVNFKVAGQHGGN
ncbi:MAG: GtrA family protein [Methylococcales bacterium]